MTDIESAEITVGKDRTITIGESSIFTDTLSIELWDLDQEPSSMEIVLTRENLRELSAACLKMADEAVNYK